MTIKKTDRNIWVVDIETLINLFVLVGYNVDTGELRRFVVHQNPGYDDFEDFLDFIDEKPKLIGFNILSFDYPVIHYISNNRGYIGAHSSKRKTGLIYEIAQKIINEEYSDIPQFKRILKCQDVYRIHHWDNKAKHSSLKWIQGSLNWYNLEEMPHPHNKPVSDNQVESIVNYCVNDVMSTYEIYRYKETMQMIDLRRNLTKSLNYNVVNASDSKLGETIFIINVAKELNLPIHEVKQMRTYRRILHFKDYILPIEFNDKELKFVLKMFSSKSIKPENLKGALKHEILYDGMKYTFGTGGLHAVREQGHYKAKKDTELVDVDVKSYYPNLAIVNNFYPRHFGSIFTKVYKNMYTERTKYPKGSAENYGYKIALNAAYGKSNDKFSCLYDPAMTVSITLNGQLKLLKLCETLTENGMTVLYVNTDGIIVETHDRELFNRLCAEWEKENMLTLEYMGVKDAFLRDVNNLIVVYENGSIKAKGAYELNRKTDYVNPDLIENNRFLHKSHSMNIVRIATLRYLVDNVPIEKTIRNHDNIYDFCLVYRAQKGDWFQTRKIVDLNPVLSDKGRNFRFMVVKKGEVLVKMYQKGTEEFFQRGYLIKDMNFVKETGLKLYDINYEFYKKETRKLINGVTKSQLSLWQL
jgi:hypothetical protein